MLFNLIDHDSLYCALDIETTGLSPRSCAIIEIGALKFNRKGPVDQFSMLINPGCPIPPSASKVHGICDQHVKDAPCVDRVLQEMLQFIGTSALVLHNAPFDLSFLKPQVKRLGRCWETVGVFDTLTLSREAFPGLKSYSLESLSSHFNFEQGGHHRALQDCRYTQLLFEKFLERVDPFGGLSQEALLKEFGMKELEL